MASHPTGRPLVGLSLALLLAGCASGAVSSPAPTAMAPPTSTSKAEPTAIATPLAYGPVTVVTGTATCSTAAMGPSTTDADGVLHFRKSDFVCTMRTDDPRVSGTHIGPPGTWSIDVWGGVMSNAAVQWGTPRLENAGGAWEGRATGVYSSDRGDIIAIWYEGTGGYDGLSYFELWTGSMPWTIQGQISPGDPPTP